MGESPRGKEKEASKEKDVEDFDKKKKKRESGASTSNEQGKGMVGEIEKKRSEVKPYVPPIPFPGRLKQQRLDHEFSKFLDIFKSCTLTFHS